LSDENLVAEQVVKMNEARALTIRISQHHQEEFWRVDVSAGGGGYTSTTVAPGDSFMMNLIQGAVSGEDLAWRHLAQWGQHNLAPGGRPAARRLA
jgi:hypothetical protein